MLRTAVSFLTIAMLEVGILTASQLPQASAPPSDPADQYRASLNRYCITCHNAKLKTAGLTLDKVDVSNVVSDTPTWEKVIRKLRSNAMPPPGAPKPDKEFYESFPAYLEATIDRNAKLNPGRPAVHRLNRAEYSNAIRDLLAVEIPPETILPADDTGYGFDNIGDVLSVSPTLLEKYLAAARKIRRLAIGDPVMRPSDETYEISDDLIQYGRMSEELPLGSRGGTAIRHNFPADGEYLIKIRLRRDGRGGDGGGKITGVGLKRQLDVRLDKARLKLFNVGGERFGKSADPNDEYDQGDPRQEEYETDGADAGLEVRFAATAGMHLVGVSFLVASDPEPEGVIRSYNRLEIAGFPGRGGRNAEPGVKTIAISGPFNAKSLSETASRQRIFICRPGRRNQGGNPVQLASVSPREDEDACARRILSRLARRAYRRPVNDSDLEHLLKFYTLGRSQGDFEAGIGTALERLLVGPEFLFRIERDPANARPGTDFRISDLELASRLAFFLWSSIPDDELLTVAEAGRLKNPAVLEQQVQRMLRDPRSKALVENFTGQWLQLRKIRELEPDVFLFPNYDENLKEGFQRETELFLEAMVRENHPLMELLSADFTFMNERLARHYGVPNVYGNHFRRVTVSDENRRGLLGHGSILSFTSYANRTSVVLRGVWLLTNILASPPPAPPPNVPPLVEPANDGKVKTLREAMEAHRRNPQCAVCHSRIDPLGFAMENFDAIGQWRTTEGVLKTPIDNSGSLPDGTKFRGPVGLRQLLLSQPDRFATSVIENLLTYAIGRGVEYYDQPVVRRIRKETAPDYRWRSLIMSVIQSESFQMRRTPEL